MEKFICLSRDFISSNPEEQFSTDVFVARDEEEAFEIVEESIATNNSQDWLLTFVEARALYSRLGNIINSENETITQDDLTKYVELKEG